LAALMVRHGLPLAAAEGSRIGFFERVLTDVGDEQSTARNLSTFSAHITNLTAILRQADARSLVLLDEVATGTDPHEGAALACAIVDALCERGSALAVSTHYEPLKAFSVHDPRLRAASVGFDVERMEPTFKKRLDAKGFVFLNWGHAGWVHFFTKKPVTTAAEMKKTKMFVWAGDDRMIQLWKDNGFQPVPLAATDILTGLQTGMIEAYPTTPLAALSLQWYHSTPYMVESGLAPLVGAMVMTKQTWMKISEADRTAILAACAKAEDRLEREIPAQDSMAVVEMLKRGLTVTEVKPEARAEWEETAQAFAAKMRGPIVPADILDQALKARESYRNQAGR